MASEQHSEKTIVAAAQSLTARFLAGGNFVFAEPFGAAALSGILPAAASKGLFVPATEEGGFAGLAVQSVGYEVGTEHPKVHVYLTKGRRNVEERLTELLGSIPVETHRIGKVQIRPEAAASAAPRGNVFVHQTRIACGSSCAPSGEAFAGTLGALVRKRSGPSLFALSNNHVFAACNHTEVGMPILSPSSIDARAGVRAPGEVCRHAEACELRSGDPALVPPGREDAALATVPHPDVLSSWQGDDLTGYDTPKNIVGPRSGMRVKKFGRTTGLTLGTVEARQLLFPLPYKARKFQATVWLTDMWTIASDPGTSFALPGDSGSLVVDEEGKTAVGLIFAMSPPGNYGLMIPMTHVAGLFGGVTLVSSHHA